MQKREPEGHISQRPPRDLVLLDLGPNARVLVPLARWDGDRCRCLGWMRGARRPVRRLACRRVFKGRVAHRSPPLLRQIHLFEERLVAGVCRDTFLPQFWLQIAEVRVLLKIGTIEPLHDFV